MPCSGRSASTPTTWPCARRAAVEWSYRLCTRQEQRVWEQLSVFAGGFTAEAAHAVCTVVDDNSTITAALKGLVDKSVLRRVDDAGARRARFRMLEPVRQFAADKLAAAPDAEEVRRRHRDYFLALARRSVQDYCSPRDIEWYATTRQEHANLRQALAFSLSDQKEPERAIEMATVLRPFWEQAGTVLEGYDWLRRALDHAPEPTQVRAHGLAAASILGSLLGEDEAARRYRREQVELADRLGWHHPTSPALFAAALEAYADGDVEKALEKSERAVQQGLREGDPGATAEAMALSALYVLILQNDQAEEITRRFVAFAESHGAHMFKAIALYPLGAVHWLKGDVETARRLMREAVRLYQLFDHPGMVAVCVEGLAWSAARTEPDLAAKLLGAARSIWKYSQVLLAEKAVQRVGQEIESQLRRELGDMAFEQQFAAGQELPYADAIDLALGESKQAIRKGKAPVPDAGLTRREREVAALVAAGLTSKEIAAKLVISHRTADAHIEHIRAKLGVRSRAQIARWFSEYAKAHPATEQPHGDPVE
jgi:DNA-binding CsgD family transcriptional regulator